jgi:hypothetical protein
MFDSTVLALATVGDSINKMFFKFCVASPKVAKASRCDVIMASNCGHFAKNTNINEPLHINLKYKN